MAEDSGTEDQEKDTGTEDQGKDTGTEDQEKDTGTEDQEKDKGQERDPEVQKAIQRRDRALRERDAAREEAAKLREKYEPKDQDPETKANRKLVRAEFKVVAAKAGVEDEDLKDLATFLDLDSVPVDSDGEVDADAIQERLDTLKRIFGKLSGGGGGKRTTRLDTRDRGGEKAKPLDAASKRRRDQLAGR